MIKNPKAALESKLMVYLVCYQEAEKRKDQKRMDMLGIAIDDLRDEIRNCD